MNDENQGDKTNLKEKIRNSKHSEEETNKNLDKDDQTNDNLNMIFTLKLPGNSNIAPENKCFRLLKILGFYLVGISCLLPLNAIITSTDCFMYFHKAYHPELVYTNVFYLTNFLVQLFIALSAPKFSYYKIIQITLAISTLILLAIPLVVIFLQPFSSFIVTCVLMLFFGSVSGGLIICLYSFLIYLDKVFIASVVTGHGLSGILTTFFRFLTFYIYGVYNQDDISKNDLVSSFFIFNYFSAFLMLINIFIWFNFIKHLDIRKALRKIQPTLVLFDEDVNFEERCLSLYSFKSETDNTYEGEDLSINKPSSNTSEFYKIKRVLRKQFGINFTIFLHGLITFSIYPGVVLKNHIFTINNSMSMIYILAIFTIFDVIGRILPKLCHFISFSPVYFIIFFRFFFIFLFPFIYKMNLYNSTKYPILYNDYFISSVIALFAFTNGFIITNSFILIQQDKIVSDDLKGKTSSVLNLTLNAGIYAGTTAAYLVNFVLL